MIVLEGYKKPVIVASDSFRGVFPAVIMPIVGLSAKALTVVGAAAGLAHGMAKGNITIDSSHTEILTVRKDFVFT